MSRQVFSGRFKGRLLVTKRRFKKASSDRDRWVCIRTSYARQRNRAFYAGEYDKLLQDVRVESLVITEDDMRLTTAPIFVKVVHASTTYTLYLGIYQVLVSFAPEVFLFGRFRINNNTSFTVHVIESGRYDGELRTSYPSNEKHKFCLGQERQNYAEELAVMGEFYTLFNLLLESFWHINPADAYAKITDFRKLVNCNVEPYKDPHVTPPPRFPYILGQ